MEPFISLSFLVLTCVVAWRLGGPPERMATLLLATAAILSLFVASSGATLFTEIEWGLFAVDGILAAGLVWLALWADRYWPLWLASLQLVSLCMHPAYIMSQHKMAFAYAIACIVWSYPMLAILALGAWRHAARNRILH